MSNREENELTDEMIEAGIRIARLYSNEDSLTDTITAIYLVMRRLEPDPEAPEVSL